jgi:redox-sensitive bicupin YhaK (pirin superfamily)
MSAGTGVLHAEYNLEDEDTTLLQIWLMPDRAGGEPDWAMREFPVANAPAGGRSSPAATRKATARSPSAAMRAFSPLRFRQVKP